MDITKLFDVAGKTALVTGGSGGIGYMIAEGLARAGCKVFIVSRKVAGITAAAERLSAFGSVTPIAADLGTAEGVAAVAAQVNAGTLNILVNNAGTTWGAPIDEFPREGFEKVLKLNLLAPFELTKSLLPALRAGATAEDPARVINIASIDGLKLPEWESYPYSATKSGLIHMTRHLGKFLAGENISVNAIAPGLFPSKMSDTIVDFSDPDAVAAMASPLGARVGTPEDISGAVLYLSSRAGAWLTGVTIPVGGGRGTVD
ncbi:SDR family NAD(P)-dependent oxidoreductase (plasmid) [Sphingomonas paeninsulae]|jgi:NAD(P)-dependent dehydrogenase (short-subunit alcohol dehydrogenase family)|uniref:SDR family NAD(P)-dependent oxidoreductase n=1 Tax=Sphingomonas paeninsulae TaxID=2319844 RepID=A0A494TDR9_SPHPE|nr:SDR family NAD(P)-dependent oxidoreductase [Sphingomonas paeninsulae]AYJ85414.1 SDR family NAD(P)-dependent oxidoreductase [Sphingomonas paeninsulae]